MVLLPVLLSNLAGLVSGGAIDPGQLENVQKMLFGALIILFLIKEPAGLARLWHAAGQRLRNWPLRP
jgi:branched-chain amino acid transport system permease protein